MKNRKSLLSVALVVLILVLGVGYAVVSSVGLSITGNAGTLEENSALRVSFTDVTEPSGFVKSTAIDANDATKGSFTVGDLSRIGDTATVTYTITNGESDVKATLGDITVTNSNEEYFDVTAAYASGFAANTSELGAGASTTVIVTVRLDKTPTTAKTANIGVSFTASPVAQ